MSIDEQHIALPQLYGAPAYARPPLLVPETERPFDPDELPIEAERTEEEREFTAALPEYAWTTPGGVRIGRDGKPIDGRGPGPAPKAPAARHQRTLPQRRLTDRPTRTRV